MKNCASCPNVVKFYSHFVEETTRGNRKLWVRNFLYVIVKIIMEFCDCGSLASFMETTNRSFSEAQISYICKQVLRSLEFLQERGVAHRDISKIFHRKKIDFVKNLLTCFGILQARLNLVTLIMKLP